MTQTNHRGFCVYVYARKIWISFNKNKVTIIIIIIEDDHDFWWRWLGIITILSAKLQLFFGFLKASISKASACSLSNMFCIDIFI